MMNEELIDQIAFQAGCDKHWYNDPNNPDLCGRIISREVLDKFAELIVRECADRLVWDDFGSIKGQMRIAGAKLKEHFEIKP